MTTYDQALVFLYSEVLTTELMAFFVGLVIIVSIFVAYRTQVWGLLMTAGGAAPVFIYYVFSSLGVWNSPPEGHVYGRLAFLVLFISLLSSFRRLYRRWKYGIGG